MGENCKKNSESDVSDCQMSNEVVYQETSLVNEVRGTLVNEPSVGAASTVELQSSSIEGMKEEESGLESPPLDKPDEAVDSSVKEEVGNTSIGMEIVKELQEREMEHAANVKEEEEKLDSQQGSNKGNVSGIKKKPASPMAKSLPIAKAPQLSTHQGSKPAPTTLSSSRSSKKIGNGSSLSKSKKKLAGESKKVAPKSLHMSISLGPSSADAASLTTRKSLIMEKMGDKDIVKRAFNTFQSNYNQLKSANEERSPALKQVPAKGAESRVSTLMALPKENAGSFKAAGAEKKSAKAAPSSLALKSDERAEKRRVFLNKLEKKIQC